MIQSEATGDDDGDSNELFEWMNFRIQRTRNFVKMTFYYCEVRKVDDEKRHNLSTYCH